MKLLVASPPQNLVPIPKWIKNTPPLHEQQTDMKLLDFFLGFSTNTTPTVPEKLMTSEITRAIYPPSLDEALIRELGFPPGLPHPDMEIKGALHPCSRSLLVNRSADSDLVVSHNKCGMGIQPSISASAPGLENGHDEHRTTDGPEDPAIERARVQATAGKGLSGYCTVMFSQVPFGYVQQDLVQEIHDDGFEGSYDFLYLPLSSKANSNLGFAIINFLNASLADAFYNKYYGQKLKQFDAPIPLNVMPARIQGFDASVKQFFGAWNHRKRKRFSVPVFLKPLPEDLLAKLSAQARDALGLPCSAAAADDHVNANPFMHNGNICYSF